MKKSFFSFNRLDYAIKEKQTAELHTDFIVPNNSNNKKILLIHGAAGSSFVFYPLMQQLANAGYEVYAINLPGHGKNKPISLEDYHLWDYLPPLRKVVAELQPNFVIGHSMGTILAQKLASEISFEGVILLSAIPPFGVEWKKRIPLRLAINFLYYIVLYMVGFKRIFHDRIFKALFYKIPRKTYKELIVARKRDKFESHETPHIMSDLQNEKFMTIPATSIKSPVLVCNGEKDFLMPPKSQENVANYYGGNLFLLKKVGHMFVIGNDIDQVAKQIIAFLNNHKS